MIHSFLQAVFNSESETVNVFGELKKWHPVTIMYDGPFATENDTETFTNYSMIVTFTHVTSGDTYTVPGHFAADGDSAETSATEGSKWRCYFTPNKTGAWNYTAYIRTGTNVALSLSPSAGTSGGFFNGQSGQFTIEDSDKVTPDNRSKGMLGYVFEHYLQWSETKEYFMKSGLDSPENWYAYTEFDGTFHNDGQGNVFVRDFDAHSGHYTGGGTYTWQGGKGTNLLGALEYIRDQGANSWSQLWMNLNGDDKNIWPYIVYNGGVSPQNDRKRFDVSKLDQYNKVLDYSDFLGLHHEMKWCESENYELLDNNGTMGTERTLFFREIISRFGHHLALTYNIGEENRISTADAKAQCEWLYANDPYRHHRVIHNHPSDANSRYANLLGGAGQWLTGPSMLLSSTQWPDDNASIVHVTNKRADSAATDTPWVVCIDEYDGLFLNGHASEDTLYERHYHLWGPALAGGAGTQLYFSAVDQSLEDFTTISNAIDQLKYFSNFWIEGEVPFWDMANNNALLTVGTGYVFAKSGVVFVGYLPGGGTPTLDLSAETGTFEVEWYNPRTGAFEGTPTQVTGGSTQSLGAPPNTTTSDWVFKVTKLPEVPTIRAVANFIDSYLIMWGNVPQATTFELQMAEDASFTVNVQTVVEGDILGHVIDGMASNVTRWFRVRSKSVVGVSNWSNIIAKTTATFVPAEGVAQDIRMVDPDIDLPISVINDGDVFRQSLTDLAIEGVANKPLSSERVEFSFDTTDAIQSESQEPYAYPGDNNGDFVAGNFTVGRHVVAIMIRVHGSGRYNTPIVRTFYVR